MTDIPNCSTCPHATFTRGRNWLNGGVLCKGEPILPDGVATIKIKGCLSHPDARAYLMAPVIKELERLSKFEEPRIYYIPQIIDLIHKEVK
jgi:hypothetical protein